MSVRRSAGVPARVACTNERRARVRPSRADGHPGRPAARAAPLPRLGRAFDTFRVLTEQVGRGEYDAVDVSSAGSILIVDDNDETRDVLQRVLQIRGYVTAEARSGPDALRWLRDGNPTRLILLDINMPGMDGWAVHAELKSDPALADIPVIVFSGVDGANAKVDDIVAYVRKGIDPDLLLSLIERTCRPAPAVTGSRSPLRS